MQAAIVDEAELGQLARMVARLTPGQRRGSDLSDEGVLSDARTWLARRPGQDLDDRD